jgi:hypothetical protein
MVVPRIYIYIESNYPQSFFFFCLIDISIRANCVPSRKTVSLSGLRNQPAHLLSLSLAQSIRIPAFLSRIEYAYFSIFFLLSDEWTAHLSL